MTNLPSYNLVFAGTPDFAATALQALLKSQHKVLAVYTQPDRPSGRGRQAAYSPVKQVALEHNLPLEQVPDFKSETSISALSAYQADFLIVAAYGIILPQAVLDTPALDCLNIHASLLPRWRGAAPIQHAILSQDKKTGISIMKMEKGLDTGDVLLKRETQILANETGTSLHDRLAKLGGEALLDCLNQYPQLYNQRQPQDERLANYAAKITKEDARIDWNRSAVELDHFIRAYNAWPVAFTHFEGKTIRIWEANTIQEKHRYPSGQIISFDNDALTIACNDGFVFVKTLQMPGKKKLAVKEILKSKSDFFAAGKNFE